MSKTPCYICSKPKATLNCGLCHVDLCKNCAQFLEADSFSFLPVKPPELQKDTFCGPCFDGRIAEAVENYKETLERAKNIHIYSKNQFKETRFLSRLEEPIVIPECEDRDELTLRLAFQAASRNFNGVIDVEITSRKVRNAGYQKTLYAGSGIPTQVDSAKLVRDRAFSSKPN